jgi:ABC-2 type transport system permease protein
MSAVTAVVPPSSVGSPAVSTRGTWSAFLTAEWIKLRTVRSTAITLGVAVVLAIGFGALACQRFAAHLSTVSTPGQHAAMLVGFDPTSQSLVGNAIAQLAIGALGVLIVTSEYATGMIRASLIAMPLRQQWIAAKLAVFGAVALVAGQFLTFTSFWIGQAILAPQHVGVSIGDPGVLRSVIATGLYLSLIGLLGACLGLIIRHTAGALCTLLGIVFILPALTAIFPQPLQDHIARFLPESIGEQAATVAQLSERFPVWDGIALMLCYVTVAYGIGALLLQRRDG